MIKGNAKTQQIKGKMKETLGKALGDKSMQRSGRGEQVRGKVKEVTEKVAHQMHRHPKD
ncbi:CsbD family protein [Streptomyces sp. NPDC056105]|uniref:CsbD family protein n=1 Tax=Streptomyces sp. NPDC056105 TaxID=3345714 RepID=UPI0035E02822